MRIYLAGPLFSQAEQEWGSIIKRELTKTFDVEVFWGHDEVSPKQVERLKENAPSYIFTTCVADLKRSDIMVAILDGPQVDDGTAWEIGYFYSRSPSKICGIRTDFRRGGESATSVVNAMIQQACRFIARDLSELMQRLVEKFGLVPYDAEV